MLNDNEFDRLISEAGFTSRLTDMKYSKDEFRHNRSPGVSKHKRFAKNRFNRARRRLPVDAGETKYSKEDIVSDNDKFDVTNTEPWRLGYESGLKLSQHEDPYGIDEDHYGIDENPYEVGTYEYKLFNKALRQGYIDADDQI